eukprot:3405178-Pleurochrysis_carterae.AAC.1
MRMNVPRATAIYNETDETLSVAQVSAFTRRVSADARCGHCASACSEKRRYATIGSRQTCRVFGAGRRCRRRAW